MSKIQQHLLHHRPTLTTQESSAVSLRVDAREDSRKSRRHSGSRLSRKGVVSMAMSQPRSVPAPEPPRTADTNKDANELQNAIPLRESEAPAVDDDLDLPLDPRPPLPDLALDLEEKDAEMHKRDAAKVALAAAKSALSNVRDSETDLLLKLEQERKALALLEDETSHITEVLAACKQLYLGREAKLLELQDKLDAIYRVAVASGTSQEESMA